LVRKVNPIMKRVLCALAVLASLGVTACPPAKPDADPAVTRGRQVYMGTGIACHNVDPKVDGAVGPAVKGASREVIESKLLRGDYPAGYKPKRTTKVMPPQPGLASSIDDLAAFLK
jgi:mono/diheme cytochrome c family protein